ncbi:MAG: hypothetical protein AAF911_02475 [Planctomycetota bacterium]
MADRVDPLVERIITQLQQYDQANATTDFTPDQRDQYIDSITRLLGLEPTAERLTLQRRVFDQFSRGPDIRLAPSGTLEITVVDYENAMNHLRAGGSLPNTAYDPEQDTASIRFDFVGTSTDSPMIIDHMVVSVRPDKPIEQAADTWFSLQSSSSQTPFIALALHEVAEVSWCEPWADRRIDPHWRWLSDGLANCVTFIALEELGEHDAARQFRQDFDTMPHQALRPHANLRYWLELRFQPQIDGLGEDRLKHARYAFATEEVQRLINDHGTDWIASVVRDVNQSPAPGSAAILAAIQRHTGADMNPRLDAYQPFTTRDDGVDLYAQAYGQAIQADDYPAALNAAVRLVELQFVSLKAGLPERSYVAVGNLLIELGRADEAEAMRRSVSR